MPVTKKELLNEAYDSALLSGSAVSLNLLSKKVTVILLGTSKHIKGGLKLAGSVFLAGMGIEWAKEHKYLPDNPFKSA